MSRTGGGSLGRSVLDTIADEGRMYANVMIWLRYEDCCVAVVLVGHEMRAEIWKMCRL